MLSRVLPRPLWRGVRRIGAYDPLMRELCGPVTLLAIIGSWAALFVIGWALVLWPYLPEGFLLAPGLNPASHGGFFDALYISLVTLTTLGYGDITPTNSWLRILVPLEAMVGFGLLTASLSWAISLYPAFSRHRSLAHEISLVREGETETEIGVKQMDALAAELMLSKLTSQLVAVQSDLVHFPISYYFRSGNERFELSAVMPCLLRLAGEGDDEDCSPGIRLRANMLRNAIDDFSATVGSRFLGLRPASTEKILTAYAHDNLHAPPELT
ncbi:MAG: two pore domain potassium channel family protein [Rubrobacter sp.]|nr:two pore domain potassium channel family protein [Rubrobacter sp.]